MVTQSANPDLFVGVTTNVVSYFGAGVANYSTTLSAVMPPFSKFRKFVFAHLTGLASLVWGPFGCSRALITNSRHSRCVKILIIEALKYWSCVCAIFRSYSQLELHIAMAQIIHRVHLVILAQSIAFSVICFFYFLLVVFFTEDQVLWFLLLNRNRWWLSLRLKLWVSLFRKEQIGHTCITHRLQQNRIIWWILLSFGKLASHIWNASIFISTCSHFKSIVHLHFGLGFNQGFVYQVLEDVE